MQTFGRGLPEKSTRWYWKKVFPLAPWPVFFSVSHSPSLYGPTVTVCHRVRGRSGLYNHRNAQNHQINPVLTFNRLTF